MELDKRQQTLIALAKKKGNDADLVLLDKLHQIEDRLDALEKKSDEGRQSHTEELAKIRKSVEDALHE